MNASRGQQSRIGAERNIMPRSLMAFDNSGHRIGRCADLNQPILAAGGGGAIVALCPENLDKVHAAMRRCGYHTLVPGALFE